ncbi:phosphoenolpyruvate synthase [Patescibacteria group bacterium]|nr:phosphoenolpyruvate synthase [Patescibacteria group bacterium]MBU1473222.1 phosphoenolpyruvate synthase [Patescibacteria group bacterium]MBU2459920.1 phosphoenolpyruvate synthase [Patescibacteria group bacterium]MBU2544137.1 phosphoenolpyruvate synthase [Patescibacteria group bacterium]
MTKKFVVWFQDVGKEDIDMVGGKGANLGEMTRAGFPVPPGFIVTAHAYNTFLERSKIKDKIYNLLSDLDVGDSVALAKASSSVIKLICRTSFPRDIAAEIIQAYFKLERGIFKNPLVAVRSSATAEDLPTASFAGQQATFLNVAGEANVIEKVREAWASLFTARAIFYRATNKFDHFKVGIAIPVQKMVSADTSGIMFTVDPVTNDKSKIVIEAIYGLGEMIVQGAVTPDHYEVDKKSGSILSKSVHFQEKTMFRKNMRTIIQPLRKSKGARQKISDAHILALAKFGKKLEAHYYFPQDCEWAIEKNQLYIVQTRPVTTLRLADAHSGQATQRVYPEATLLLKGDPASPGLASGTVKWLSGPKEIHRINRGDVLVAEMTNPDYVPAMRKAVAIVTERGGRTSHAAIVSRELGIPAIVGAKNARRILKNGAVVTVNGSLGEVYKGAVLSPKSQSSVHTSIATNNIQTATKVYVNLAEPSRAEAVAKLGADGVGLLRAEFMIADIGVHPRKFIADKRQHVFIHKLADSLETICSAFSPRPVIYRATDFRTNEYRNLKGGAQYEPPEDNPMLGFRGAARYVADSKVFDLELEAIKLIRNKKNLKNLSLMIPFVRTPKELLDVKKIVASNGLFRSPSFKLWMMVELPTNVISLEKFLDVGIDGVSIGSNDLTMLILGTDRDNSEVAHIFNEMDESLLWAFERVIKICSKRKVTVSMCGQAPSDYPELVDKLVSWGITSISVNPDIINNVRMTVYEAEKKHILSKSR